MIHDTDALKTLRNSAFVHNHSFSPSWPALAQGFRRAKKTGRWPRGSTDEARSSPGSDSGNETGPGTHWHARFWPDRGNTAIAPQIITDCGNLTLDFMQLGLWASPPFLQTLGPWFPNEIQNLLSSEKRILDHWATVQFVFSLAQVKTPLTLSVVQEWLNKRNTTTVAKFLDTSVCGGSWCLDPSLSPFLVKFTQILESILLDNPHKAAVLSVDFASFSSTLFPSTQLSVNMLGYSTLWTASFFGNECLWLTLLVKGVNDCLLDNCQISSLPHDCVA